MYGVIFHDFYMNVHKQIYKSNSKINCLLFMENYIDYFIEVKMGCENKNGILKEKTTLSSKHYNDYPYGYFKATNAKENPDRITVYLKILYEGYLYNTFQIFKVISLEVFQIQEEQKGNTERKIDHETRDYFNKNIFPFILKNENLGLKYENIEIRHVIEEYKHDC